MNLARITGRMASVLHIESGRGKCCYSNIYFAVETRRGNKLGYVPCALFNSPIELEEKLGQPELVKYVGLSGEVRFRFGDSAPFCTVRDARSLDPNSTIPVNTLVVGNVNSVRFNGDVIYDHLERKEYREAYRFIRAFPDILHTLSACGISDCKKVFEEKLGKDETRVFNDTLHEARKNNKKRKIKV